MAIDNDIYNRLGETWWDEDNVLNILHGSCTPGRMAYFREVLRTLLFGTYAGRTALDVGCGCGFLAEEFARLGFSVTGVDPSEVAISAARKHAGQAGLSIRYVVGTGEELPVGSSTFDVVYCCDVLEHVTDLPRVLEEAARALRPGGLYLFDTINRTRTSRFLGIKVMQDWSLTKVTDAALHDWNLFITPDELTAQLSQTGLGVEEIAGLAPRAPKPVVLKSFYDARRGRISYGELSRRLDFGRVKNTRVSYMGYARKPAAAGT
ncbi:bifunctional 2-polyprenyl-6-hydroxyphenol methylase/3-demethylubiquinol 3-O-methyltransferase UbiG [Arthrobacter zhaoguopingii]|uniref:bifunctional 2-polyprenyl-6-hydroxyphenol methylase/3-demethylubiquinol 3-O-methyltransferase UbiG n=1 Tax=Arthrobacter zhaoguopingii TaxID=2681491 RepID=UPI0013571474|nr:bifunctional 2-polyprenyl-6-hydroxyphenol methylase/3-demethylubiquinol 3-O-methyltransferase UbiG [Arthrobacter zhaoguopingii]